MYILGISSFYHDSAASLIKNGEIFAAAQEERFTRKKHDSSFPINSIKYLLDEADISLNDIEAIVFYEKPFLKFERLLETHIAFAPMGFRSFAASMPVWLREKLFQKKIIFENLQSIDSNFKDINKIKFSEHHLSHAASAFFPSPFDEALILTLDGVGEWATTTLSIGKSNSLEIIKEIHFPHSLGLLYSAFTYYLGFKVNSGEYKVMGLAPYGQPIYKDIILEKIIKVLPDGSFRLNMKYFSFATHLKMINSSFEKLFNQKTRIPEKEKLTQFHMDIAASLQNVIEEIIIKIVRNIKADFKIDNLCLAGGVALNCVANGKILEKELFKNVWVQPAAGDAGGSLGAALSYWYLELNKNRKIEKNDSMKGSFIGPSYNNDEIKKILDNLEANYDQKSKQETIEITAKEIAKGKAVGWFQGRMEFGPRSLGCRSIIASPLSEDMQKTLNLKVKFRESFRPFAPSILEERVSDFFKMKCTSPYMLFVANVNDEIKIEMNKEDKQLFGIEKLNIKKSLIPAVTHVDYSARVQTVNKKTNERFYDLIKKFEDITSYPILVNTSFNVRGEPIVNTPEDAFRCFMGTGIDILVIEDFILFKKDQKDSLKHDYKEKFELD